MYENIDTFGDLLTKDERGYVGFRGVRMLGFVSLGQWSVGVWTYKG